MTENKNEEQEIRAAVEPAVKAEQTALEAAAADSKDGAPSQQFIYDCLMDNERGDGALFAYIHRHSYLFNNTSERWLRWAGHHWSNDRKQEVYHAVKSVVDTYRNAAKELKKEIAEAMTEDKTDLVKKLKDNQIAYTRRANRLNATKGARECISWANRIKGGLGIFGEELDRSPWLLACNNGVLDLKTGRFRDGRPDDFLSRAVPHDWPEDLGIDTPAPVWEAFLLSVFNGDKELIAYVQRLFGYALTGLATEHVLPVLHGPGRNGKGVFVETLRYVLGVLAQPIQSEMLLDQRSARASSGPSPDIMSLKALRIAFASETDEGRRFSTSKAKWLSGGDTLTGRNPHDKYETIFEPTHLLCMLTNHLPHAPGDDFAFWQRIHLIPFKMKFIENPETDSETERPRDKNLQEKLKAEAPAILVWLMKGGIEWQKQGLNPPLVVRSATEQYRFSEDLIAEFLKAKCRPKEEVGENAKELFKELYKAFEEWYTAEIGDAKYVPKKKKFGILMEKRFKRKEKNGQISFHGVLLKPEWVD